MKKFILNLLKVMGLLLAVSLVIQLGISWAIKDKTINGQDNFHIGEGQKNDIVFMGSSRCSEHFDPRFFKDSLGVSSANLGVNGHGDITMQLIRLKRYLVHNPAPKVAILNFDPLCTYGPYNIEENDNLIEKHYYARYAFMPRAEDAALMQYFHFNFAEKYIPLYALLRYRSIIDCITLKGGKLWLKNGYQANEKIWDTVKHPPDVAEFHRGYSIFLRDQDSVKAHLQFFNNFCSSNGIKLVCVQTSVHRSIYDPNAFAATRKMCDELGILFIDTNEDFIIDDLRNFTDPDHLNTTGTPKMLNIVIKNNSLLQLIR